MNRDSLEDLAERHGLSTRPLADGDLSAALALSSLVHWNQVEADWQVFLDRGTVFGLFEADRTLVATAAILPFPPAMAWISMVIVHPARRRLGLARGLVHQCLRDIDDSGLSAGLDASEEGSMVYPALGFVEGDRLSRLRRPELFTTGSMHGTDTCASLDWQALEKIEQLDHQWSGIPRGFLLRDLTGRRNGRVLWHPDESGHPGSYLFTRQGRTAIQLGPLGARKTKEAIHLIETYSRFLPDALYIDIPDRQVDLLAHLTEMGWVRERGFVRMVRGTTTEGAIPDRIFAAAGPEFS